MNHKDLSRRLRSLEAKSITSAPWHTALMERMKIYEQIYEGTADLNDPLVQKCVENTKRYKRYFDELEAGVAAPRWP
jgi:hypothetical protein